MTAPPPEASATAAPGLRARRILLIGSSGAGKSTLARAIADRTGLPLIHLDRVYWRAGWQEPGRDAWRSEVAAAAAGSAWVIDGNYAGTFDLRMPRAELILWLDYDRRLCLLRALKRIALNFGRNRPDMADGCPERIDLVFLRYIWSFPAKSRPGIVAALAQHSGDAEVVRLSGPRDARSFLARL